jgi:cytochrome c oxidase subunit 2
MKIKTLGIALGSALGLSLASSAWAVNDMPGGPKVNGLNLQEAASSVAAGQHFIHEVLLWVCLIIFVAVFSVMFYSIFAHRRSRGHKAADFHESTAVEIAWTVVPFIIVVGLAVVATGEVIAQKDTSSPDITVKATGYQWKWGYDYIKGEGEGIGFLSTLSTPRAQIVGDEPKSDTYLSEVDNPLVVPVGKKVRVITTANDVIHSWYVPALGVKQDAIPGFVRDTWFRADKVGTFRGYCAELCGKDHAFMPIVVEVKSAEDYSAWVAEMRGTPAPAEQVAVAAPAAAGSPAAAAPPAQETAAAPADQAAAPAAAPAGEKTWTKDELVAHGEQVYAANCASCHQANGQGLQGAFPALAGSAIVQGPAAGQIDILLNGKAGTAMVSFARLSDADLAGVITYTRNSWGNSAEGDVVTPADVQAAR